MNYDDASSSQIAAGSAPDARPDIDALNAGDLGPAAGNVITGTGTITGAAGADSVAQGPGQIVALRGAGGSDSSAADGSLHVRGRYGELTLDSDGDYSYTRNSKNPNGVSDTFTYTLADATGEKDQATLTIDIRKEIEEVRADAQQLIPGPDGVVILPAGVQLSDIRVVGSDLVIILPDGSQMVIPNGAVFVPQLVIGDVEVPPTNLAALLIDAEPRPASGTPQSSGGNFGVPVGPLDPGIPLGDLIPPTELVYTPPEFREAGQVDDEEPEAGAVIAQLDDDALEGGIAGGTGDDPDSVNANGFLPGSGGDGDLTWSLLLTGAPAGFTYVDGPGDSILVQQGGVTVLTITVDAATGAYTVVQNAPIDHAPGDNENNVEFVINYTVTDEDGDVANGTLTVNVDDDTPTVDATVGADGEILLTTQDAETIGANTDTASTTADFGGIFGATGAFGADGPGTSSLSYALSTTGGASGLTSHGAAINLYLIGGVVVGSTAANAGAVNASNTVFDISVDANTGVVTVNQYSQVDHTNTDPSPTGSPFDDHLISLPDGAVTLTLTASITDADGDTVTDTASAGIGANIRFADDGPTIDPTLNEVGSAIVDESAPVEAATIPLADGYTRGDDPHLSGGLAIGKGSTSGAVIDANAVFGADGPANGGGISYDLVVLNAVSGLTTTEGTAINLVELSNGVVVGVVDGTTTVAFAITIDPVTGVVTVEQYLSLFHPDSPDNFDEPVFLDEGSLGVTVTATDFDGDSETSDAVDITSLIRFEDDGPSVDPELNADATVTVDESLPSGTPGIDTGGIPKGDDPDLAGGLALGQANSGVAIVDANAVFGADGPAAEGSITYSLSITNADSGVTLTDGTPIELQLINGVIVGVVDGGAFDGQAAFAIAINPTTGVVTVEQYLSLDHPVNPDPNDPLGLGENTVAVNVTATDGDGDQIESDGIDISGQITFLDDGPAVAPTLNAEATVTVDETLPSNAPAIDTGGITKGDDPDLAGGLAIGQANSGVAIVDANAVFGADGPAAEGAISYALVLGANDTPLTLTDGSTITLQLVGGVVVGVVDNGPFAGQAAFAIAIDSSTGVVSVEQYLSLDHPLNPNPNDPLGLGPNTVGVTVTATDGDGDPVTSDAVDISNNITFLDDGPSADPVLEQEAVVQVDESLPSSTPAIDTLTVVKGNDPDLADGTGTAIGAGNSGIAIIDVNAFFGADGPAAGGGVTYALSILNASSGVTLTDGTAINLQLLANGVVVGVVASGPFAGQAAFAIAINAITGVVTVEQYLSLDHPVNPDPNDPLGLGESTLGVTATVTDGDGDSITTDAVDISDQITFFDDGPAADPTLNVDATVTVDESLPSTDPAINTGAIVKGNDPDLAGGIALGQANSGSAIISANAVFGADGPALSGSVTYALSILNASSGLTLTDGTPIDLVMVNGVIVGVVDGGTFDGQAAFAIAINPTTGVVSVEQYLSLDHPVNPDPNDPLSFGENVIGATVTVTDGDGDPVTSDAVDIGGQITFLDDGPVANNDVDSVVGGFDPATGNVLTGVEVAVGEDANDTDGVADAPGADGGRITSIDHENADAEAVPNGGSTSIQGDYGVLTIYSNGDYSYQRDPGTPGGVEDVFTYTLTDGDGDSVTATLTIGIDDNFPTLPDPALVRLDDDALAGGNPGGDGDDVDSAGLPGQLMGTGGDGDLDYNFTGVNTLPAGFTTNLVNAGTLQILQGATVVLTITLDNETGAFNVVQNNPILHPADNGGPEDNIENNLVFQVGVEVEDSDGDTEPATITINVDDDTPTIDVTKGDDSAVILTTDDADTIGVGTDTAVSAANFSGVFGLTQSIGADGGPAASLAFTLDVTGFTGGDAQVDSGLNQGGNNIYLYEIGGKVVGSTSLTLAGVNAGNTVFDVAVSGTGVVTLTQYSQIDHVGGDPTPTGSPFVDHIVSLADNLITLTASSTITDNDGDSASDSETVNIGANLRFTDDGPDAQTSGQAVGTVTLDETRPEGTDTAGGTAPNGDASATIDFSVNFVTGGSVDYGADGPGTVTYQLQLTGTNVNSGLYALDNTDLSAGDGDGYGQGGQIVLNQVGNTITGSYNGVNYFTITIDPATGIVTFTQLNNIWHPTAGSSAAALDESATLNTLTADLIQVIQTVTDFDGDTDTASIDIGRGVFIIQDDGPRFGPDIDATLSILNDATPSNTGDLDIVIGTDSPNGGTGNNNPDDISVSNFTVSVNGVAIPGADVTFTPGPEDATTASYDFSFDYDTGSGGTATATGTLVFDKAAGTYTVTLTSGPIEGFSLLSTGAADASDFVSYQVPDGGSGSPEVTVAALDTDFFVQFSSVAEPGSGTGANNLTTTSGAAGSFDPVSTANFGDLELFSQAMSTVQISSTAAGVAGNTIQGGEVLDLNLYATDPMGTLGGVPTQSSTSMFMTLDGIGTSEDMIVILKLYDTVTGQYTTKAIIVQNADILTDADALSLVGTPYEGLGAALDNNDGLIVIEANDYQEGNPNLVIVGAQIAGSDEGITGSGINLNGAVGDAGGSIGTQDFSVDTSDAPFKITSIGFLTTSTEDQSATIDFDVTIHDADGDTATQHITVDIGDTQSPALLPPEPESFSLMSTESLLVGDSQEQQLQKSAANTNTLTLAAAVAAAGIASMPAAANVAPAGEEGLSVAYAAGFQGDGAQGLAADDGASRSALGNESREAADEAAAPSSSSAGSQAPESSDANALTGAADDAGPAPSELSQGTDAPANDSAAAATVAQTVAMPSAEMLEAAGNSAVDAAANGGVQAEAAQSNAEVARAIAESLGGGHGGPDIDTLLAGLPGHSEGAVAAIQALASHGGAGVPGWDMAALTAFQAHATFSMDAVAMHQDAGVQSA